MLAHLVKMADGEDKSIITKIIINFYIINNKILLPIN